jgi:hypothetical protein
MARLITDEDGQPILRDDWSMGDIKAAAKEMKVKLTTKQATQVMENTARRFDAEVGINWDVIKCHINMVKKGNMDILVKVHVGGDYNSHITAAKVSLDEAAIKHIQRAARDCAKDGLNRSTWDNSPELGTSDLDLEINPIMDMASLADPKSWGLGQVTLFKRDEEIRTEIVELHFDSTDFWWEGVFKHTDTHWETAIIPVSLLPQLTDPKPVPKTIESGSLPETLMTADEMNAIHEKIAQGMNHGLNAREIDATFQRHVTKAQLIRLLMEHIERNH